MAILVYLLYLALANAQQFCLSPTPICDCFVDADGMKVVNCRYKGLVRIPAFSQTGEFYDKIIFTSTEETGTCLPQSGCNNITSLHADAFANINVKIIDLRNNAITSFDPNAFRGLEDTLNVLLIEGDGNISPPYGSISVLRRLLSLHLENFLQTNLTDKNTHLDFPELLTLTLDKINGLETITQAAFSSIPKLTYLYLRHLQSMVTLPVAAIVNLHKLQVLSVSDTRISRIYGDSFSTLDALHKLELTDNKRLVAIDPHAFRGAEDTLEVLQLQVNALSSSVLDIFHTLTWNSLKELFLSYNTLPLIPDGAFNTMPNLEYLDLESVGLTSVNAKMFSGLTKLNTLNLGYNNIARVSTATFHQSPELKELRFNEQQTGNQPISFAPDAFHGIESTIQRLFIERNTLNTSQLWDQIARFTNLTVLDLEGVGLTEVPDWAFANNVHLTSLDLSDNRISQLTQATFYGPRETLVSINMQNNRIETIGKCVFIDFDKLPSIRLFGNPLVCDCRIAWLYDWVQNQTDNVTISVNNVGTCNLPAALKDKYFFQFSRSQLACSSDHADTGCKDLYSTTTTTTTTIRPVPHFQLYIVNKTPTSMTLSWLIDKHPGVTAYVFRLFHSHDHIQQFFVDKDALQYTIRNLVSGELYTICMMLQYPDGIYESKMSCETTHATMDQRSSSNPAVRTTSKNPPDEIVG